MTESLGSEAIQRWGGYEGQPRAFHQKENGDCLPYVTLSVGGLKLEGDAMESRPTADLATKALFEHIESYLDGATPIWRWFPEGTQDGGRFYAAARLVKDQ